MWVTLRLQSKVATHSRNPTYLYNGKFSCRQRANVYGVVWMLQGTVVTMNYWTFLCQWSTSFSWCSNENTTEPEVSVDLKLRILLSHHYFRCSELNRPLLNQITMLPVTVKFGKGWEQNWHPQTPKNSQNSFCIVFFVCIPWTPQFLFYLELLSISLLTNVL